MDDVTEIKEMNGSKFDYSKVDDETAKELQIIGKEINTLISEAKENIEKQIELSKSIGVDIKDILSEEEKVFYENILGRKI